MPGVHSNSCPSSRWCHPTISSSVIPFSSCLQSLPASGSFPMSQLFEWGGQSNGVSASASVPPMNTQDWSPSGWTGWISLQSKGLSRVGQLVPKPSPLSHSPSYSLPLKAFPGGSAGKVSTCNAGDLGSIQVGKIPWRRERLPTAVSGLENSWVAKSWTQQSDFHFLFTFTPTEKLPLDSLDTYNS